MSSLRSYPLFSYAAHLATCLGLLMTPSMALQRNGAGVGPVFSDKANRLIGIYEIMPESERIPGIDKFASPALDRLPLTPSAAARVGVTTADPKDLCQVLGPFRLMARSGTRFEILRDSPNKLVMLFENDAWGHVRTIRIDADHISFVKVRPMWNGDSTAVWDADTLVVDTVHFTDRTWINERGVTNSKQLHLVERYRPLSDGKYVEYRATATDPNVLLEPVSYIRYFRRTTKEITEYNCFVHRPGYAAPSR